MVMPLLAVGILAMFAMAGLVLEAGNVYMEKTKIQHAADAAALAAVREIQKNGNAYAVAVANSTSAANGYTHGANNTTVAVNIPPGGSGSFASDSNYVRVTITRSVATNLAQVVGVTALAASGSAVGGPAPFALPCVLAMPDPINSTGVELGGSSSLVGSGCGFAVRSTHSKAIKVGGSATASAGEIRLGTGAGWEGSVNPTPTFADPASNIFKDPFAGNLPAPALTTCKTPIPTANFQPDSPGGTVTYCSDVEIKDSNATFQPGIYIFDNKKLKLSGSGSMSGSGIFLYFAGKDAQIELVGSGSIDISAPTSGTYQGTLMWQDAISTKKATLKGGTTMNLNGISYFPSAEVELTGGSGSTQVGAVIARQVTTKGSSTINMSSDIKTNYTAYGGVPILYQ